VDCAQCFQANTRCGPGLIRTPVAAKISERYHMAVSHSRCAFRFLILKSAYIEFVEANLIPEPALNDCQ
jgi:hypothetical protein